jgi:16S rRNA (guanine527-N7)-methyltransferase
VSVSGGAHPPGFRSSLVDELERSRERGFLGPGPLGPQIEHARGFAALVTSPPGAFLDLGSGGGLPGLVLADTWRRARGVLLDASKRRTDFLRAACDRLGMRGRIEVRRARAEVAARDPGLRGQFDVVTARSFGPPAVAAECGVAFLRAGGRLIVSEPPSDAVGRWSPEGLARLCLELEVTPTRQQRYAVLRLVAPVDDRWPRRTGIPNKRPLWR